MDKFIRNRIMVLLIGFIICFIMPSSSYAQNVKYLEKRVAALEERVRKLELQLDKALNPAKYEKVEKKEVSSKQPDKKLSPVESPLRAKLFNKKLKIAEPGEADDNLAFLISFENKGHVGIISFKGEITFKNLFGDSIMSFEANIQKPIPANKSNTWFGGVIYDANDLSHQRIMNMDIKDILVEIRIERIAFSDGTIKEAEKEEK